MSSTSNDLTKKLAIGLDFDGVIHAYSRGYFDGTCYDVPVEGAFDAIRALMVRYNVFVFTARKPEDVKEWFDKIGKTLPVQLDLERQLLLASVKNARTVAAGKK